jgi:glycosyltransferase involved in cell wall biosynthesis
MSHKIALVYDRLNTTFGGAEQVLLALHQLYPQADLFTSVYDPKKAAWAKIFRIKSSFLQSLPLASKLHRYLALLMPLAFESLDLSAYEIIISITSAEAKSVITRRDQLHLCYLLSPPRYIYHYQDAYLRQHPLLKLPLFYQIAKSCLKYLQNLDQQAIRRVDLLVPIAKIVAKRVKKYYDLDAAQILYPPIDQQFLSSSNEPDSKIEIPAVAYYLLVARLVPYKNVAFAIKACLKLGRRLIVVGDGPELRRLQEMIPVQQKNLIKFYPLSSSSDLKKLYQNCTALLSPALDDFGIAALEANLFAKPVIINKLAGAAEIIQDQIHGLHLDYQEDESLESGVAKLATAIEKIEKMTFETNLLVKNARKYDTTSFTRQFSEIVEEAYQAKLKGLL